MKKAGIVDPTKVSRSALQNAASVAAMILTTESIVTDKKRRKSLQLWWTRNTRYEWNVLK